MAPWSQLAPEAAPERAPSARHTQRHPQAPRAGREYRGPLAGCTTRSAGSPTNTGPPGTVRKRIGALNMNVSTTTGQARIQPHEGSAVRPAQRVMGGGFLIGLEWQRECQADAEVEWLLKQNGVASQPSASRFALLRQT